MKKIAFTLAEILITIAVIGVVSAITIPSVVKKYQEMTTVNKVKKFYAMMSQALLLSIKDNGPVNEWNVYNTSNEQSANEIASYIKPYLKILKDCGTSSGCLKYQNDPKRLSGSNLLNYDTANIYYKLILIDGSYLIIRSESNFCKSNDGNVPNTCGAIYIDISGSKEPNTIGRDIFAVHITPYSLKPNMTDTCKKNSSGWSCMKYILENGNMNYLH